MSASSIPSFCGMIGVSVAMRELWRRIERLAPLDLPVLVRGETGTGKELVARAIQALSPRRAQRFEPILCATLRLEPLLSVFLHGGPNAVGANTEGLLAALDGGTLLLDDVGELPPVAQEFFACYLETGAIRPLGSGQMRRVGVRLIATALGDLDDRVRRGAFRQDLYDHLRKVVLEIPPLRDRREDIPPLVAHLRVELNRRYGCAIEGVTTGALAALQQYGWRGNVRQLESVLEQAMIFKGTGMLSADDLELRGAPGPGDAGAGAHSGRAIVSSMRSKNRVSTREVSPQTKRPR